MNMTDQPWLMRTYSGHSTGRVERAVPHEPRQGPDRPVDRLRPAHPDRLRPRCLDGTRRGRQGRRADRPSRQHAHPARRHPARADEHVDDDQRHGRVAAGAVRRQRRGAGRRPADQLRGTTQNDIVKEYLSRGTYIFPPEPSRRLIVDMVAWCAEHAPPGTRSTSARTTSRRPGATPVQEMAYAPGDGDRRARRRARLRAGPSRSASAAPSPRCRSSSTPASGSSRRLCKLRAFTELWDRIGLQRYGVENPKDRRFRYGVQVNSLGLTEAQPENNVQRIVLEMLAVTLSKRARARSIQLPAWNEALGLPRPWDQQWSLRMQQVLAYETDLLEYEDLFDGSSVVEARTAELRRRRRPSWTRCSAWAAPSPQSTCSRRGSWHRWRNERDASARRADRGRRQPLHGDRAVAAGRPGGDPARRLHGGGGGDRRRRALAGGATRLPSRPPSTSYGGLPSMVAT